MAGKLMTLKELSDYLNVREQDIIELIDLNVIIAYKIGGELLRFRKEQIDATRSEIDARLSELSGKSPGSAETTLKERIRAIDGEKITSSFTDRIKDFFYFNDFYLISVCLIILLLMFIIKG
jgi:excisionase family DNA binding protein